MREFSIDIDATSFKRDGTGPVTGFIHVNVDGCVFPGNKWTDFPVIIVAWWIDEYLELLNTSDIDKVLRFMDGPYYVSIKRGDGDRADIALFREGEDRPRLVTTVSLRELADSLLEAAALILGAAEDHSDLSDLRDCYLRLMAAQ